MNDSTGDLRLTFNWVNWEITELSVFNYLELHTGSKHACMSMYKRCPRLSELFSDITLNKGKFYCFDLHGLVFTLSQKYRETSLVYSFVQLSSHLSCCLSLFVTGRNEVGPR